MQAYVSRALAHESIQPVLVDIGASGPPPKVWRPIARQSVYMGFDPDLREVIESADGPYGRAITINKAVTADPAAETASFYLTASPHCSSTLVPDLEALSDFAFAGLFEVEQTVTVPAISLDRALAEHGLTRVDWFKTDSQGTDLRLFTSLTERTREGVLAVDMEPGLIDAYKGEDLFVAVHSYLTDHGFWLSNLRLKGTARISTRSIELVRRDVPGAELEHFDWAARVTPGWGEARYFRTVQWLEEHGLGRRAYLLLAVFALLDRQPGFAVDVCNQYEHVFGADATQRSLLGEAIASVRARLAIARVSEAARRPLGAAWRSARRVLRKRIT